MVRRGRLLRGLVEDQARLVALRLVCLTGLVGDRLRLTALRLVCLAALVGDVERQGATATPSGMDSMLTFTPRWSLKTWLLRQPLYRWVTR